MTTRSKWPEVVGSHMAAEGSLEPAADGWYYPKCTCGAKLSIPFPDLETMVDALMAHAYAMGSPS